MQEYILQITPHFTFQYGRRGRRKKLLSGGGCIPQNRRNKCTLTIAAADACALAVTYNMAVTIVFPQALQAAASLPVHSCNKFRAS